MKLNELTIVEARKGLKNRDFSAENLTKDCLTAIAEKNSKINAFITVFEESALREARKIDEKIVSGEELGILGGIPLAIKDNILIEGTRCTSGSRILENYISAYDATVIKRLREAGAIFLGKTNMDEFAFGSSTETSFFGPTKNPSDLERVPGGSSGGSAASVAANMCLGALGSDTGGSVRQPASLCGLVGFKPSYGRVSRYGLMAMASSLDQISPFAKTVRDAEIIYKAMAGQDRMDSTTVANDLSLIEDDLDFSRLRVGVSDEYMNGLSSDIRSLIEEKVNLLRGLGAEIKKISLPHTEYALPVYYVIMPAEVSSNLSRYDGIRYGYSVFKDFDVPVDNLFDVYTKSRATGFSKEVKRRIMIGAYALSSGYYDAYYKKASQVRSIIKEEFARAFNEVDVIIGPTTPDTAWKIGEKMNDPVKMYLSDIYTVSANVAGIPAISVPAGDVDGLPIGAQVMAKYLDENTLLKVAKKLYI